MKERSADTLGLTQEVWLGDTVGLAERIQRLVGLTAINGSNHSGGDITGKTAKACVIGYRQLNPNTKPNMWLTVSVWKSLLNNNAWQYLYKYHFNWVSYVKIFNNETFKTMNVI